MCSPTILVCEPMLRHCNLRARHLIVSWPYVVQCLGILFGNQRTRRVIVDCHSPAKFCINRFRINRHVTFKPSNVSGTRTQGNGGVSAVVLSCRQGFRGLVQYSLIQFSTVQFSTIQFSLVQFSTVQFSTVQFSLVQFSLIRWTLNVQPNYLSV